MNEENSENYENICCCCLLNSNLLYPLTISIKINEKNNEKVSTIHNLLENICCSQVIINDNYPQLICNNCLNLLKLFHQFKIQYENSQEILKEMFGLKNNQNENVSVELICGQNRYNLNDILIVEEETDNTQLSYEGFLNNLGTEISASFVNNRQIHSVEKEVENFEIDKEIVIINEFDENLTNITEFSCNNCGNKFQNKNQLTEHIKLVHEKFLEFTCSICGHISNTISSKRSHQLKHNQRKTFDCSICNKSYSTQTNLNVHLKVHKNERKHLCNICGKGFNYKNALIYHLRIHTGEKLFICDSCGMEFTMPCSLKRHERTHTNFRPYSCQYCEKCFKSKGELNVHEMLHTGRRPYHCQYCGKGFTKTFNLHAHYLSHRGPHECCICPKNFIEIKFLKIHLMNVHNLYIDLEEG